MTFSWYKVINLRWGTMWLLLNKHHRVPHSCSLAQFLEFRRKSEGMGIESHMSNNHIRSFKN